MKITQATFTQAASSAGGAMIGFAAMFLMSLSGCVMGIRGILSGLLVKPLNWPWRLAFVIGVIVRPLVFMAVASELTERQTVMLRPFS